MLAAPGRLIYSGLLLWGFMRRLVRFFLLWAISGALFYLVLLPLALDHLSKKAQGQGYDQCKTHLTEQALIGSANSPVTDEQGEKFCHCVSDGLILTKNDVFDLARHRPAKALGALAQQLADQCNKQLQKEMFDPSRDPSMGATDTDGLIHF